MASGLPLVVWHDANISVFIHLYFSVILLYVLNWNETALSRRYINKCVYLRFVREGLIRVQLLECLYVTALMNNKI